MQVRIENLSKKYAEHDVSALQNLSLAIEPGEFAALMGPSGCGKSTLLNLIAGIDRASSGKIYIGKQEITSMSENELASLRCTRLGFVFQFFNLLSTLTVEENVSLPLMLSGKLSSKEIKARSIAMLEKVGLQARASFYPSQLSGGEMQRVAIARAIVHEPQLIIADEPTGNLDTENGQLVLKLLLELCKNGKHTTIMATHSQEAAAIADRVIHLKDGRLQELPAT